MRRWIIGIGLVAVIAIGAFIFRDFLPSNAGELKVGDCFDIPTGEEIGDVQHHPCNEAHDGEVILVADFTGSDTYPSADKFDAWVNTECIAKAFPAYVGEPFEARDDLDLGYFYPKEAGWTKDDDKVMICYLTPAPSGKVTVSYAKAAPAAS
jgi:hypothetical protein